MKRTFRSLLVASAVAAAAASVGAAGIDARQQTGQAQQSQSSQSGQSQGQSSSQAQDQSSQPAAQGRDEAAARQELVQAKQALLDLTKLPEASQLQGEARNGVISIINSFNSLVTADTNWYDRYKDVQQQLGHVLGTDVSGSTAATGAESGSTGTSGTSSTDMPAAIRSKLVEFRQHLSAFGKAAGAPENGELPGAGSTAGSSSSGSTSGMTSSSGQSSTSGTTSAAAGETFQQHFDAIGDLVQQALGSSPSPSSSSTGTSGTAGSTTTSGSTTGTGTTGTSATGTGMSSAASAGGTVTVDRATLEQIQSHLQRLRQLAREKGVQ